MTISFQKFFCIILSNQHVENLTFGQDTIYKTHVKSEEDEVSHVTDLKKSIKILKALESQQRLKNVLT